MGLKGTPSSDRVAIAALANLVRLLCAELVAGRHRDDIELLENAVRAKLNISVPGASANDLAAGLRLAHEILGPILRESANRLSRCARMMAQRRFRERPQRSQSAC